jgi:hypothetical protein
LPSRVTLLEPPQPALQPGQELIGKCLVQRIELGALGLIEGRDGHS